MDSEVKRLSVLAAELPPDARATFLERECPDPAVRAEVDALIRYADEAEGYFDDVVRGVAASLLTRLEPSAGQVIGNYRIVSSIGQGGMGSVYLAQRADGEIEQRVAIKLLRGDGRWRGPGWRQRFLRERQLLASLHHPSVVQVLDAGHTEDGRPYLVMEYVDGVPVDRYSEGIDMRERLKLFLQVCEGVSHAHRHLIIHRDLKPSNILVDPAGRPKLLDFGIAKLLNETGETTQVAEQLLTPNYASPEQLRGKAQSTATDVYSLGAVLYKLLTGAAPREKGWENGKEAAPSRVNPEVPGDLDYVVAKALREETDERYGSVEEFAADVRAVLERRPVAARGCGFWYRTRRNAERHWVLVTAGLLVVTSLAGGLWVANRERQVAERRFTDVRQLANKLFDIQYETRKLAGSTKVSQLIVDTALEYLRRLAVDVHGEPDLALDLGTAYLRVARVQGVPTSLNLGQMDQAEKNLRTAEGFIQSVLSSQPGNRTALLRMAQISHDRMLLARFDGRRDDVRKLVDVSSEWLDRFQAGKQDKAESSGILSAYLNIADQYARLERFEEALRVSRRANEFIAASGRRDYLSDFLWITSDIHRRRGELAEALKDIDESGRQIGAPNGREMLSTMNYAYYLICRGELLAGDNAVAMDRPAEAIEALERAFQIGDEFAHRDAYDQAARSRIANAGIDLADLLTASNPARALAVYDHTYRHLAEIRNNSSFRRFEVNVLTGSSYALRKLNRPREAKERLNAAFERLQELKLYPTEKFRLGTDVEQSLRALADHEADTGNLPHAVELYNQLLTQVQPSRSGPETSLTDAVHMSTIYRAAAAVDRRAGFAGRALTLETRDRELWRHWDRTLPNNPFVKRQMAAH